MNESLQVVAQLGTGLANAYGACCRNQTPGTGEYVSTPGTEGGQSTHTIMAPHDSISARHWFSCANVLGAGEVCARKWVTEGASLVINGVLKTNKLRGSSNLH